MESLTNPGLGVEEKMEQSEFMTWFQEQFEKLDSVCQRALIHRYYEGRSMKEIAGLLGYTNEGTARNKRYECVRKLRKLMEEFPPPDGIFLPEND